MHKKAISLGLVGVLVLYLLFHFVGSSDIIYVFARTDKILLFSAVAMQFLMMFSWNLKWKFLFRYLKIKITFWQLFPILLVGNLGDAISPGARIGGEPLRLYYLNKAKIKTNDSLTTILLERVYNIVVFLILSVVSITIAILKVPMPIWLLVLMMASLSFALTLSYFLFSSLYTGKKGIHRVQRIADKILPRVYKWKRFKIKGKHQTYPEFKKMIHRSITHFFEEVIKVSKQEGLWAYGIFLSFLHFFQIYFQAYIIFWAVGAPIPFYLVVAFISIADLVGMMVMVPSGVGIVELLLIVFAQAIGVPLAPAVTAVLIIRAIYYLFSLGAGYGSILWLERK